MDEFQKDLESLINKHSLENGPDTPDFLLAEYLTGCLAVFNKTVKARDRWYGKPQLSRFRAGNTGFHSVTGSGGTWQVS
jgi:hypothetical protein